MALFEDTVSGQGEYSWGGSTPGYALVRLLTVGGDARRLELTDPDHVLRVGWFTFFHEGAHGDEETRRWYDPPIWIDFETFRWHPNPARVGTDNAFFFADGIRWSFGIGSTAYILVDL